MKLFEKIKLIRKEKKIKLRSLHRRLREIFGEKALEYNTLYRIEKGYSEIRGSSLHQICTGLGITLKELKEGTEDESRLAQVISRHKREDRYVYDQKAYAQMLSSMERKLLALELNLSGGGKTRLEQDPVTEEKFEKWIYVLQGKITVYIGTQKYILLKGDALSFESSIPHYFENALVSKKARCIIVQNPKNI